MGLLTPVVRTGMRLWYAKTNADRMSAPTPRDRPVYETGDPAARRVLLLGNGPTHGWGVVSHQLALTGHLGRALSAQTGDAWDVDYVGDELMNVATALNWLGRRALSPYDLIVLVLSMNDAVRLTPLPAWGRSMSALLDHLDSGRAPGAGILIAGVQPIASVPGFGGLAGMIGQRHADRLNATTRGLLESVDAAAFTDLGAPRTEIGRPAGSSLTYSTWAERLAGHAVPLLAGAHAGTSGTPQAALVPRWAGAAPLLAMQAGARTAELKRLEEEAKRRFGVPLALVTLLEGDRQYFPTGSGPVPASVPRELTFCDVTAAQSEPLVVPNARKDPRFAGSAYIDVAHTPFYAGAALRSREGDVIGTFCLMGAFPRKADRVDVTELERLAGEAERILWRVEDDVRAAAPAAVAE
ncbi:MAG TPA: GAF domain-containing protein [Amnibacterium sp.]|uniref:GAF domain-containing protein n=1 Tax=Amnibacterium sp. TaxID=1872496 RepID=UPI002F95C2A7